MVNLTKEHRMLILGGCSVVFFFIEIVSGFMLGSMALIADSFHMLSDIAALIVAWIALKLAKKHGPQPGYTYGYQRAEILGGFANGVILLTLSFTIILEALQRFVDPVQHDDHHHHHGHGHGHSHSAKKESTKLESLSRTPPPPHPPARLKTHRESLIAKGHGSLQIEDAVHGNNSGSNQNTNSTVNSSIFVLAMEHTAASSDPDGNILTGTLRSRRSHISRHTLGDDGDSSHDGDSHMHGHEKGSNVNMKGLFLHALGDAMGNSGVILSALVIVLATGDWRYYFDPIASVLISILIVFSAVPLVKATCVILMQGVPEGVEEAKLKEAFLDLPEVVEIKDLHIWGLTDSKSVAAVHVVVRLQKGETFLSTDVLTKSIEKILAAQGIHQSTIQITTKSDSESASSSLLDAPPSDSVSIDITIPQPLPVVSKSPRRREGQPMDEASFWTARSIPISPKIPPTDPTSKNTNHQAHPSPSNPSAAHCHNKDRRMAPPGASVHREGSADNLKSVTFKHQPGDRHMHRFDSKFDLAQDYQNQRHEHHEPVRTGREGARDHDQHHHQSGRQSGSDRERDRDQGKRSAGSASGGSGASDQEHRHYQQRKRSGSVSPDQERYQQLHSHKSPKSPQPQSHRKRSLSEDDRGGSRSPRSPHHHHHHHHHLHPGHAHSNHHAHSPTAMARTPSGSSAKLPSPVRSDFDRDELPLRPPAHTYLSINANAQPLINLAGPNQSILSRQPPPLPATPPPALALTTDELNRHRERLQAILDKQNRSASPRKSMETAVTHQSGYHHPQPLPHQPQTVQVLVPVPVQQYPLAHQHQQQHYSHPQPQQHQFIQQTSQQHLYSYPAPNNIQQALYQYPFPPVTTGGPMTAAVAYGARYAYPPAGPIYPNGGSSTGASSGSNSSSGSASGSGMGIPMPAYGMSGMSGYRSGGHGAGGHNGLGGVGGFGNGGMNTGSNSNSNSSPERSEMNHSTSSAVTAVTSSPGGLRQSPRGLKEQQEQYEQIKQRIASLKYPEPPPRSRQSSSAATSVSGNGLVG
ncbi:hypothetical protein HDU76_002934 [Blyttiomyces sp. JEL0837]|nr:hypothetical protein HDU76_002934 [Blyttiomyces sp. JEL0837]